MIEYIVLFEKCENGKWQDHYDIYDELSPFLNRITELISDLKEELTRNIRPFRAEIMKDIIEMKLLKISSY
jgi:hypothetical protein